MHRIPRAAAFSTGQTVAQYGTREMKLKMQVLIGVAPDGVGFYTEVNGAKVRVRVCLALHTREPWVGS